LRGEDGATAVFHEFQAFFQDLGDAVFDITGEVFDELVGGVGDADGLGDVFDVVRVPDGHVGEIIGRGERREIGSERKATFVGAVGRSKEVQPREELEAAQHVVKESLSGWPCMLRIIVIINTESKRNGSVCRPC
jgi:hypothetical protein